MTTSKGEARQMLDEQFEASVIEDDVTLEHDLYVAYSDEDLSEIDVPADWEMKASPDGIHFDRSLPTFDTFRMAERLDENMTPAVYQDHHGDVWLHEEGEDNTVLVFESHVEGLIEVLEQA